MSDTSDVAVGRNAWRPATIIAVGLWLAFMGGAVEVLLVTFQRYAMHSLTWTGRHFVWMAPLSYVIAALPITLILATSVRFRVWPNRSSRTAIFILLFLPFVAVLSLVPALSRIAMVFLAVGAAYAAAGALDQRSIALRRLVRRTLPVIVAWLLLAGPAIAGWKAFTISRTERSLRPAGTSQPNVLLIILDAVRAQNTGLSGYARPTTPHLDALGQRGAIFTRAIATSSWSLPSHASLMTGHYPSELSVSWRRSLDRTDPTIAEAFQQAGYRTGGFTANLHYASPESGLSRGFMYYTDYPVTLRQLVLSGAVGQFLREVQTGYRAAYRLYDPQRGEEMRRSLLNWIGNGEHDRPFFAFVNLFDAHDPYRSATDIQAHFPGARAVDRYDAAIAYFDRIVGEIASELEARGLLDNTVLVITADHGEQFGEHGLRQHGNGLYIQALHVPLIVVHPSNVPPGTRIDTAVTLRDIPRTLLALAGLPNALNLTGESLDRFWSGGAHDDEIVLSELETGINTPPEEPVSRGAMSSLIRGSLHYIRNGDGVEELYDLSRDPGESQNVLGAPDTRQPLEAMRRILWAVRAKQCRSNPNGAYCTEPRP